MTFFSARTLKFKSTWRAACSLAWVGVSLAGHGAPKPPGDLTGTSQLFVDDFWVSSRTDTNRVYHPFEKDARNPVFKADRPWERRGVYLYGTVLPGENGRGYRMWYQTSTGSDELGMGDLALYATSPDGIRWEKPSLGIVEFQGSTDNNILFRRTLQNDIPQVIATPWEKDPARRYKLINYDYGRTPPKYRTSGFLGAVSPDGIHWTDVPEPVLADPGDVGQFVWDPHRRQYLGYTKIFAPVRGFRRRSVGVTSARDFEHFRPSELVLTPDVVDDRWIPVDGQAKRMHTDFYGLSAFAYESSYIGLLWIFRITEDRTADGPVFAELVSSRDGVRWVRQEGDRTPILPLGPGGSWDSGQIYTSQHPLVEGDQIKLFYGAFNVGHHSVDGGTGSIGLATMRKDGFASLDAGAKPGVVLTRPFPSTGGTLTVNAVTRGGGELTVEVVDAAGQPLPGYRAQECTPLAGAGTAQAVTWGRQRKLPKAGKSIRLRFELRETSLYSFNAGAAIEPEPLPVREVTVNFEEPSQPEVVVALGKASFAADPARNSRVAIFSGPGDVLELADSSHLGNEFTLSVFARTDQRNRARLFSTHRGVGEPATGELLFDANPASGVLRFIVNGQPILSRPRFFRDKAWHHFAVTYHRGRVELYLDGQSVGSGQLRPGTAHLFSDRSIINLFGSTDTPSDVGIHLSSDLRVGGDMGGSFVTFRDEALASQDAQLVGEVDNVHVAWRACTPEEVARLAANSR